MSEQDEQQKKDEGGSGISRRTFLKGAAAGAVAAGVMAAVPSVLAGSTGSAGDDDAGVARGGASGSMVVCVADPSSGEVLIMSGTKEVVRRDASLVSRIVAAGVR